MKNLKGKKLLVLGGSELACDIVERAKKMDIITIVTNYDENSPAKKIADKSFMVSTTDTENLIKLCTREKIDGVFTSSDISLPYAQKVCEHLGLPFCATSEQLDRISNKKKAKQLCIENELPVPKEYVYNKKNGDLKVESIHFPVLVKPVDSSGQSGISICNNLEELDLGVTKAINNSPSKKIVIEEYLEGDYLVLCFTIQDGYLSLSAMADKLVLDKIDSNGMVRLPKAYIMPSMYIDIFYSKYYEKFKKLVKQVGIKNGSFGVEAIVKDNTFYFFEMQCRLGGMKHQEFVLHENGIDIVEMNIRYAITGDLGGSDLMKHDNPRFKKTYALLNVLLKPGTISSINGLDEVKGMTGVIKVWQVRNIGDHIEFSGTLKQIFAKIAIVSDSKSQLNDLVEGIYKIIQINDKNGKDMVLSK